MGGCLSTPKSIASPPAVVPLNIQPTASRSNLSNAVDVHPSAVTPATTTQHNAPPSSNVVMPSPTHNSTPLPAKPNTNRRKSVSSEPGKMLQQANTNDSSPTQKQQQQTKKTSEPKDAATTARLHHIITNIPILKDLDSTQQSNIVQAMFEVKVKAGDVIIKQGEEGDNFYVIEQGMYAVLIDGELKKAYQDQGSFGELALMYDNPRAATVRANTDGVLWALDRATFRTLVVASTIERRKRHENFLRSVKLFQQLSSEQLAAIAECLDQEEFVKDQVILQQGQLLDEKAKFYILESGTVECYRKHLGKRKLTRTLQPGDVFGEVALLTDEPRQADCVATSDTVICLTMSRTTFERLMGPVEQVLSSQVEEYKRMNKAAQSRQSLAMGSKRVVPTAVKVGGGAVASASGSGAISGL